MNSTTAATPISFWNADCVRAGWELGDLLAHEVAVPLGGDLAVVVAVVEHFWCRGGAGEAGSGSREAECVDGAHRISCERGSRAWSSFCVSRHFGRAAGGRGAVPLFSSQSNHQVPTPPRRRTRQGLDEDLHGACSARGSTTVCTAAPARRGRAAVGAGGGGAGRGARALSKDVPGSHRRRGRGRGVAPAGRRRRPRRPPPPRVAGAQHCAACARRPRASSRIDARIGGRRPRLRRRHRRSLCARTAPAAAAARALTAAPPAATRFTSPASAQRQRPSPVNLRFATFPEHK